MPTITQTDIAAAMRLLNGNMHNMRWYEVMGVPHNVKHKVLMWLDEIGVTARQTNNSRRKLLPGLTAEDAALFIEEHTVAFSYNQSRRTKKGNSGGHVDGERPLVRFMSGPIVGVSISLSCFKTCYLKKWENFGIILLRYEAADGTDTDLLWGNDGLFVEDGEDVKEYEL